MDNIKKHEVPKDELPPGIKSRTVYGRRETKKDDAFGIIVKGRPGTINGQSYDSYKAKEMKAGRMK